MKAIEERERLIEKMAAEQAEHRLSQYRKSVSRTSDLKAKEFFANPYLINMMGCCLVYGAKWSDANPYLKWTKYSDREPIVNEEVIAFNKKWIDEDLNPNGTRVGFLNLDGKFIFACKSDKEDCYETINSNIDNTEPEYWLCISDLIHDVLNKHNEIREVNLMEK